MSKVVRGYNKHLKMVLSFSLIQTDRNFFSLKTSIRNFLGVVIGSFKRTQEVHFLGRHNKFRSNRFFQ